MDVTVPKLGEGADSGVVVSILVKEGIRVEEGQTIIELENEKAVASIPATASGTVTKIRVKEGDKISVGQVILTLDDGSRAEAKATKKESAEEAPRLEKVKRAENEAENEDGREAEEVVVKSEAEVAAAPSVRKLARELGVDLTRVRGSEPGGRIVMADLRAYIQRLQKSAAPTRPGRAHGVTRPAAAPEPIDFSKWGKVSRRPVSQLRKVIVERMSESWARV